MLVIVDMQEDFRAAKKALPGVLKAIKNAIDEKRFIVVVEYDGYSETTEEVFKAIGRHPHKRVVKYNDCGAGEIIGAVGNLAGHRLEICGVNATYCVRETAEGLVEHGAKVKILPDAVWCSNGEYWRQTLIERWPFRLPLPQTPIPVGG